MTPPVIPPDDEKPSTGRDIRLVFGCLCLLGFLYVVIKGEGTPGDPLTTRDLIQDGMLLIAGLLLIAPGRLLELLTAAKDWIPVFRKSS